MTVYKNQRDKWTIDIDDFFYPDGRKEPRIRKTAPVQRKAAAEQYERDIRQALFDGTYGKKPANTVEVTLASFEESYLNWFRSERRSETGTYNNESLLRKHLVPLFGDRAMTSFGGKDELALKAHFKGHSASRYNQAAAVMNKAIELYYMMESLKDPFRFGRLKIDITTKPFYEFDDYAKLLGAAVGIGINSELVVRLGRDAGLRRSEMWGLTPSQVRMNERRLVVERAETIIGKKRFIKSTKGRELRTLDMTPALHDCFRRYFEKHGKRERIVCQHDGSPHTQKSFIRFMETIQRAAGLEVNGKAHILRHTFCSHMAIRGVPVKVIQALAGHRQLSTTLGYMHLAPGDEAMGIRALSD